MTKHSVTVAATHDGEGTHSHEDSMIVEVRITIDWTTLLLETP